MESGFNLDIQAKSTTTRSLTNADVVHDLDVKTYDDLRDVQVGCPRILVLLVLPEDENQWTELARRRVCCRAIGRASAARHQWRAKGRGFLM
jgi:hypothetical protein